MRYIFESNTSMVRDTETNVLVLKVDEHCGDDVADLLNDKQEIIDEQTEIIRSLQTLTDERHRVFESEIKSLLNRIKKT